VRICDDEGLPTMKLTQTQVEDFNRTGVLFLPEVFTPAEVARIRAAADRVAAEDGPNVTPEPNGSAARMVHGAHDYDDVLGAVCRHPRLIEPAEQLLGSGVYVHQSRLNVNKGLGTGGFYWHQDYATWRDVDGLKDARALMITVFVDDMDNTNGPLLYIPGSHGQGVLDDFEPDKDATGNVLMRLSGAKLRELSDAGGIEVGTGKAGSVLIMHCNIVHGSSQNISPNSRTLFYVNVTSVENPQTTFARAPYHAGRDFTAIVPAPDDVLAA
jgi:ectoine hydroxylase